MTKDTERSRFEGDDVEDDEFDAADDVPSDVDDLPPIERMFADTEAFVDAQDDETNDDSDETHDARATTPASADH